MQGCTNASGLVESRQRTGSISGTQKSFCSDIRIRKTHCQLHLTQMRNGTPFFDRDRLRIVTFG